MCNVVHWWRGLGLFDLQPVYKVCIQISSFCSKLSEKKKAGLDEDDDTQNDNDGEYLFPMVCCLIFFLFNFLIKVY